MTSATERIRAMLDERGVEYTQTVVTEGVLFTVSTSDEYYFILVRDNNAGIEMWSQYLTPEQAIAATLGAGTCHITDNGPWGYPYVCSECGASFDPDVNNGDFNYCPNCGRRVEQ